MEVKSEFVNKNFSVQWRGIDTSTCHQVFCCMIN